MKTIEEEAKEFLSKIDIPDHFKSKLPIGFYDAIKIDMENSFKAGVEFAQRWIPVEEELPGYGVKVLVMIDDISGKVHPNEFIDIDYTVNIAHGKKAFDCEIGSSDKVTHWRSIELK